MQPANSELYLSNGNAETTFRATDRDIHSDYSVLRVLSVKCKMPGGEVKHEEVECTLGENQI